MKLLIKNLGKVFEFIIGFLTEWVVAIAFVVSVLVWGFEDVCIFLLVSWVSLAVIKTVMDLYIGED